MPLYEYDCLKHGRFEIRQPMSDEYQVDCPKCGKPAKFKISSSTFRMAVPFSVFAHDGTLLHTRQTTEKTPPLGYRYENENLVEV